MQGITHGCDWCEESSASVWPAYSTDKGWWASAGGQFCTQPGVYLPVLQVFFGISPCVCVVVSVLIKLKNYSSDIDVTFEETADLYYFYPGTVAARFESYFIIRCTVTVAGRGWLWLQGKRVRCPEVSLGGVLIFLTWALINHKVCDTWPVRR